MGSTVLVSAFHVRVWWLGWVGWRKMDPCPSLARPRTTCRWTCGWGSWGRASGASAWTAAWCGWCWRTRVCRGPAGMALLVVGSVWGLDWCSPPLSTVVTPGAPRTEQSTRERRAQHQWDTHATLLYTVPRRPACTDAGSTWVVLGWRGWSVVLLDVLLLLHPFNGPLSGTTQVSRYQKGKTNLDFTETRDSEWQWHQPGHMQVCTSLQTDNHVSNPPLSFYRPDALPAAQPTASKHWRHPAGCSWAESRGRSWASRRSRWRSRRTPWTRTCSGSPRTYASRHASRDYRGGVAGRG